ncbi:MAG: alpha-mannosidase [Ignavibacteriales bacterium]|nr:alpha-mannosidase [Ignavibacteriales bacterium]
MAVDLLDQILPHIKNAIYPLRLSLQDWRLKDADVPGAHSASLRDHSWAVTQIPFQWLGDKKTYWFRKEIRVPEEFTGKQLALLLEFQEALLFINGKPYHGLGDHHKEVFLTDKSRTNETFLLAIQAFSGRKRGVNTFNNAELVVVNRTARALYNGLTTIRELDRIVGHSTPESKELRELIRRTLIFLKYFKPEGEEYPNAIARAQKFLISTLETEFKTSLPGIVHLVPHSHVDIAWLWRPSETAYKAARVQSTVLRLMEEFPECRFTQSQALLSELTRKAFPDIFKQVKQRILEGRWEAVSPLWVEQDYNIPGGEALIRNILLGKRYFKNELETDSTVAWLPDSLGFAWSLPQILKKSGITSLLTTKLLRNDTTVFPHSSFWWQGIDGTRILVHIPPAGLDSTLSPKDIRKSWENFLEKDSNPATLQTFGYSNEGGGINAEQLESSVLLKTITGLPASLISSAKEFFSQAEQQGENLPAWNDELYVERHRGTYTTQAFIKKESRYGERLLYNAELFATLAMVYGKSPAQRKYPSENLKFAWKTLLRNQYHEILSGTSIAEVYEEARKDFEEVRNVTSRVIDRAAHSFIHSAKSSKEFTFVVFNTLPAERSEYAEISVKSNEKNFSVHDGQGQAVQHQVLERNRGVVRILCYVPKIPPFSTMSLTVRPIEEKPEYVRPWKTSDRILETPLFKVRLDKKGALSSVYDKMLRRELIERGKRGNLFQAFQDTPEQADVWELDQSYERQKLDIFHLKNSRFVEMGPLRARIRLDLRSPNGSSITQDILLYHQLRRIDFQTRVNWRERRTLLKVAFPLNIKTNVATYDIQFGSIKRNTKPKLDADAAKFEVPAQQWADLSEQKLGVSLLNDCKYGYDARANVLRLSLIRSPFYPHPNEPWRLSDDKCTDQGEHQFTYSLYPHPGDWKKGETVLQARMLNNSVVLFANAAATKERVPLAISKRNVQLSSLKKAEDSDDLILRLYECHGETTDCSVAFDFVVKTAEECDLLENPLKGLKLSKGRMALKFQPFEIKTLKLGLRKKITL